MADLKVTVDYSELTGLIKTTEQSKRSLSLMAQSFAKTGDQSAYMAGINKIVAAQQKLDKSSRLSRSEIMKLGNQMKQEAKFADALTSATSRLGVGLNQTRRGTNQLGVMMQQTGYQVGDFAVQVGSGQNAMVAFGQQATQLVGTMAMFAKTTKMIALFSGLGIAIPVISGIAAAFMRSSAASKDASDGVKGFGDRLKTAREQVKGMKDDLELLKSGFSEMFEKTLTDNIEVAEQKLKEARENFMNTMAAGVGMAAGAGIDIGAFFRDSPEEAEARVKAAEKELEAAKRTAWELQNIKDLREQTVMIIDAL